MRICIMSMLGSMLRRTDGATAVIFALVAPALVGVAGIAIDFARYNHTHANLQGLADGAAVAAVQSMAVANMAASATEASVQSYVKSHAETMAWQKGQNGIGVSAKVDMKSNSVEVQLSEEWQPMLAHYLTGEVKTPVVVRSTASMVGSGKACAIALDETANRAFHMDDSSDLSGEDCGIFSNSTHKNSLVIDKDATLSAALVCSAGGSLVKKKGNVSPDVTEDCPAMEDPLAGRAAPSVGGCDFTNHRVSLPSLFKLKSDSVYCGGLTIDGAAIVDLEPGIYIIKDGPLVVKDASIMRGKGVGFYLTGTDARFEFGPLTTISLEAPVNGPMAGLLFFEDRGNAATSHLIQSMNARMLLGTIYLPKSKLELSANAIIASDSAYTALVVNQLQVREGPNVVLNSDYDATDVPVPAGLIGGKVVLTN